MVPLAGNLRRQAGSRRIVCCFLFTLFSSYCCFAGWASTEEPTQWLTRASVPAWTTEAITGTESMGVNPDCLRRDLFIPGFQKLWDVGDREPIVSCLLCQPFLFCNFLAFSTR